MNKYYVYEWYNVDTDEVFYIGKGANNRYSQITGRNKFFTDYYNTHKCKSRIIKKDLSEKDAFELEIETIKWYKENTEYRLTNQTEGGEGRSFGCGELNPKFGKGEEIMGEKNPFYGKKHSDRVREILSEKAKQRTGEKNSFYGKTHSDETKEKIRSALKGRFDGENNPNYGRKHSDETKKLLSELMKKRKYKCVCKICNKEFEGRSWNSSKCDECKKS